MVESDDVILSGVLRKKKNRINNWVERYFVLRGPNLEYYIKPSDPVMNVCFTALYCADLDLLVCNNRNPKVQ